MNYTKIVLCNFRSSTTFKLLLIIFNKNIFNKKVSCHMTQRSCSLKKKNSELLKTHYDIVN